MVLSKDIEIQGTDGVWRKMDVSLALSMKPDDLKKRKIRCLECHGHVRLHGPAKSGNMSAHAEHQTRWVGCPRSDSYDHLGLRSHPNPVI